MPHKTLALRQTTHAMIRLIIIIILATFVAPLVTAQRMVVAPPPPETFTAVDRPTGYSDGTFTWEEPWGYRRPENAGRVYPLVVFGPWNESGYFTTALRQTYPAFYLVFEKATEADGADLSDRIDKVMASQGFRIALNRIYLTGFSMGGSGSYKTIRGFLSKGKCFAGLIRLAGQSESVLAEGAINKIAISMHIGLKDDKLRIDVSRALYAYIRNHPANTRAVETVLDEPVFGRTTKVLTLDGVDVIRYSEYPEMGHTTDRPYLDPALFSWLMTRAIGTPTDTYATWRAANFTGADLAADAISGPSADPVGAGVTNLQRYAFALAARGPVASPVTTGTVEDSGQRYLTLTFPRRTAASDLNYVVEASTDLAAWSPIATYGPDAASPLTHRDTVALTTTPRRFLRLRLTTSP